VAEMGCLWWKGLMKKVRFEPGLKKRGGYPVTCGDESTEESDW